MLPIEQEIIIPRKDVARLLKVSVHLLEVWYSNGSHTSLHTNMCKIRGRCYYRLSDVEDFLKVWDGVRYYEIYTKNGLGFLNWLSKQNE